MNYIVIHGDGNNNSFQWLNSQSWLTKNVTSCPIRAGGQSPVLAAGRPCKPHKGNLQSGNSSIDAPSRPVFSGIAGRV